MHLRVPFLIATAVLLVGAGLYASNPAQAQGVGTSSLAGMVCVAADEYPYMAEGMAPDGNRSCNGPLPNATVRLTAPGPLGSAVGGVDKTVTTDANGAYQFSQIADGTYKLEAVRTNFAAQSLDVKVSGATNQDLSLAGQTFQQSGKVLDQKDRPIAGVAVSICCAPADYERVQEPARTGADGTFTVPATAGYRNVNANDAPGFQDSYEYRLVDGTPLVIKLQALPPPDAYISGLVRDQDGNPVAGARVDASSYGGPYPYASDMPATEPGGGSGGSSSGVASPAMYPYYGGGNHTTTGADGRYRIGVYSGSISVTVSKDGHATRYANLEVAKGQTATHDVELLKYPPKTAHIAGRVTDADSGKGLQAVSISIRASEYGIYECSDNGLQPEPVYYSKMAAESMPIRDPGPNSCAIKIAADGTFSADVTPGYSVIDVYYQQYLTCAETSDADGSGSRTCGPDYFSWTRTIVLRDGDNRIDIKLEPRPSPDATVSGYVLDAGADGEDPKPIPGATLWFTNQDNGAYGQATTDQDGSFKVRLRSGYHTITVSVQSNDGRPSGFLTWQGILRVEAGDNPFDVELTRGEEQGGYCCYIMEKGGAPAPMAADGSTADGRAQGAATATSPPGGTEASDAEFEDLGGGLGPYDPEARQNLLQPDKASPSIELFALVAVLGLLGLALRRRVE